MKLHVAAIGKPRADWARRALDHYQTFLKKYGGAEFHFVPAIRLSGNINENEVRRQETTRLLQALPERATRIFLDPAGKTFDSLKWAQSVAHVKDKSAGPVGFIIGGALGLDLCQQKSTDEVWSLSALTFPHELALVVLCEQLARGLSILRGDKYHN